MKRTYAVTSKRRTLKETQRSVVEIQGTIEPQSRESEGLGSAIEELANKPENFEIAPEQPEHWAAILRATEQLHNSGIGKYKIEQTLEKAKRLSVRSQFQLAAKAVRERWKITPHLPPDGIFGEKLFPENVMYDWAFKSPVADTKWHKLRRDVQSTLCKPFGLDWMNDCGLVVAAVCFGLTPENILNHWDRIWFTASKETSPGVDLFVRRSDVEQNHSIGSLLTIAYLAKKLVDGGISLKEQPEPIVEWVRVALKILKIEDKLVNPLHAPRLIDVIHGRPDDWPDGKNELYIHIKPGTERKDIFRTWPQVELRKIQYLGKPSKHPRIWITYKRDVELAGLFEQLGSYERVIREYDKRHPEERIAFSSERGDIDITEDMTAMVRQAVSRTRRR